MASTRFLGFVRKGLSVALLASLVSCQSSFGPLTPELAARLEAHGAEQPSSRRSAQLEMEGMYFSGSFEALLVSSGGPRPNLRLQVTPGAGGEVLDLAVGPERIVLHLPLHPLGRSLDPIGEIELRDVGRDRGAGGASFLTSCLLEALTPLTPARVLGQRRVAGGHELLLEPALAGIEVRARVDGTGRVTWRRYRLRALRWSESIDSGGRVFRSRFAHWDLREAPPLPIAPPPAALFELELPAELLPTVLY